MPKPNKEIELSVITQIASRTVKHILWAEEGNTGEAFLTFIDLFSEYSAKRELMSDENIHKILAIMAQAQERNDMLFVAYILQYEIITYLKNIDI